VVKQYDYNGKLIREIQLPAGGTAGGFGGKKKRKCCIILLLIHNARNDYFFEPKAGKSGFIQPKWTLKR
jgi:prolyl oligopeptidase